MLMSMTTNICIKAQSLKKGENDENRFAHVKKRAVDSDGKPIGKPNYDPRLDSRLYEIEYLDGNTEILSENTIAESLINDVDDESNKTSLLSEIIDHRRTQSVTRRKRKRGVTTKGWEFCVQWIDGSSNWVPLKDMQDSYPTISKVCYSCKDTG